MTAQELKHMARLEEWKGRVRECRGSGQSVRAWCREQGIAYKTYYYWEKAILSEAGRKMAALGNGGGSGFVEVPALPEKEEETPALAARVRTRSGELEVYAGAEAVVLETLLRVWRDAE